MLDNQEENQPEIDSKVKLKRIITEKTRPDTLTKGLISHYDNNNLNSVLKNADTDRVLQIIKVQRTETAGVGENKLSKDISPNEDVNNKNKLCLNTNIDKSSKKKLDNYFTQQRLDKFGTPITKGGKQKVTLKKGFIQYIDIESFKEFNKMEEVKSSSIQKHTCCIVI